MTNHNLFMKHKIQRGLPKELEKKKIDLHQLFGAYRYKTKPVAASTLILKKGDITKINSVANTLLRSCGDKIETILIVGGLREYLAGKREKGNKAFDRKSISYKERPFEKRYKDIDLKIIIDKTTHWYKLGADIDCRIKL